VAAAGHACPSPRPVAERTPSDHHGIDVAFVNEMLVGPVLARMGSGTTEDLDPQKTIDFYYDGIRAR
jgi:hypothetical protein